MDKPLRQRALRLLAQRDYSRAKLEEKLLPHAPDPAELAALLDEFAARGFISDARYAAARIEARRLRYGNARLGAELKNAGVDAEAAAEALAAAGDEFARAAAIWRRKFGKLPASDNERGRQMRYFASRGFAGSVISRLLRGEGQQEEEE